MNFIKRYSAFLIILFAVSAQAQKKPVTRTAPVMPINPETKLITYSKVVPDSAATKIELRKRAEAWINSFYANPTEVMRERDTVAQKIVCKPRFKLMTEPDKENFSKEAGKMQYTLTLQFKDGRYKYDLSEINWKQLSYYPIERWMDSTAAGYSKDYVYYLIEADSIVKTVLADLEKNMKINTVKPKKPDW
jgi:hypothetical protein